MILTNNQAIAWVIILIGIGILIGTVIALKEIIYLHKELRLLKKENETFRETHDLIIQEIVEEYNIDLSKVYTNIIDKLNND